jgi:hypothetical protein
MIRAKFIVNSITQTAGWGKNPRIFTVRMSPVGSGSEENEAFYASTPTGQVELGLVSEATGKEFEIGQCFYVDFTPASK